MSSAERIVSSRLVEASSIKGIKLNSLALLSMEQKQRRFTARNADTDSVSKNIENWTTVKREVGHIRNIANTAESLFILHYLTEWEQGLVDSQAKYEERLLGYSVANMSILQEPSRIGVVNWFRERYPLESLEEHRATISEHCVPSEDESIQQEALACLLSTLVRDSRIMADAVAMPANLDNAKDSLLRFKQTVKRNKLGKVRKINSSNKAAQIYFTPSSRLFYGESDPHQRTITPPTGQINERPLAQVIPFQSRQSRGAKVLPFPNATRR